MGTQNPGWGLSVQREFHWALVTAGESSENEPYAPKSCRKTWLLPQVMAYLLKTFGVPFFCFLPETRGYRLSVVIHKRWFLIKLHLKCFRYSISSELCYEPPTCLSNLVSFVTSVSKQISWVISKRRAD